MFRDFVVGIPRAIADAFRGRNLLWHALAIVLTAVLVFSGFDWWYYTVTRSVVFRSVILIAGLGGFLVPVIVPIGLSIYGAARKDARALYGAAAVAQAGIVAWLVSSGYKVFTGRIQPNNSTYDISHHFNFGFLQHGIFWGWPSSHACVAFATCVTLFILYRSRTVRFVVILWAPTVAFGASVGFHWFSDVIAGVIIGTVIGVVVAKRSLTR